MPLEIKGKHLRVRIRRRIKKPIYRYHDIGQKGHTLRLARFNPKTGKWITQSFIFPIVDVLRKRPRTMKILRKLGVSRKAQQTVRLAGVI